MVRTLVFHTNNVGSIPTGLSILKRQLITHAPALYKTNIIPNRSRQVRYSFRFVSLIAPSTGSICPQSHSNPYTPLPKRLLLRRSYLIVSWLFYMTSTNPALKDQAGPRVAILPARNSKYTLQKAPMAHKTNSKEQFLFRFYKFKFSFNMSIEDQQVSKSLRQGAYAMNLTKDLFPAFETNLLFLKSYEITYPISDASFFQNFK